MNEIYVVGVGMTRFGRMIEHSIYDMVSEAAGAAFADAGCRASDIGSVFYGTMTNGIFQGQTSIPGPIAMRRLGIEGIPVFTVDNACATGSSAFNLAVQCLRADTCEIVLAVGAEKMHIPDKAKMFSAFDGGWDVTNVEDNRSTLLALGRGVEAPPGTVSERPYSVFMDVYAAFARQHMGRHGTTQRQIAAIAAKNHLHSVHNANAQFRTAYSIEEVLASPPISYPLTTMMCSPISDGAAAVVLATKAGLDRLKDARSRAVRVLASVVQTGSTRAAQDSEHNIVHLAAKKAYQLAGVDPSDVDAAEVHDATAIGEIINAEALMLVPAGEGGPAGERGEFTLGGRIPINPSGGLESKGHPIGATGLGQIHELVTQLRGEAGRRQVENARIAIQENGGGLYGVEEAVVAVNIFANAGYGR